MPRGPLLARDTKRCVYVLRRAVHVDVVQLPIERTDEKVAGGSPHVGNVEPTPSSVCGLELREERPAFTVVGVCVGEQIDVVSRITP